jgi:hypothetical protein
MPTTGRKQPFKLAMGLALLTAVAIFVAWPQVDRITPENGERISAEMTAEQVEAILGPPGDYRTRPGGDPDQLVNYSHIFDQREWLGAHVGQPGTAVRKWQNDSTLLEVFFGNDGRVTAVICESWDREEHGPLDILLWRLNRQWRRWFP